MLTLCSYLTLQDPFTDLYAACSCKFNRIDVNYKVLKMSKMQIRLNRKDKKKRRNLVRRFFLFWRLSIIQPPLFQLIFENH
jgi:hypothetical protein